MKYPTSEYLAMFDDSKFTSFEEKVAFFDEQIDKCVQQEIQKALEQGPVQVRTVLIGYLPTGLRH